MTKTGDLPKRSKMPTGDINPHWRLNRQVSGFLGARPMTRFALWWYGRQPREMRRLAATTEASRTWFEHLASQIVGDRGRACVDTKVDSWRR